MNRRPRACELPDYPAWTSYEVIGLIVIDLFIPWLKAEMKEAVRGYFSPLKNLKYILNSLKCFFTFEWMDRFAKGPFQKDGQWVVRENGKVVPYDMNRHEL